jgi:type IV pilus assembly protein PilW
MLNPAKPMRGFSLVELMVGVVLAIIASIVMFQVFAFSERQKRTVTGASDAQTNGALAMDSIVREVRMAGFGLTSAVTSDCNPTTTFSYNDPGGGGPIGTVGAISQPVRITSGSGNAPDTIRILVSASDVPSNFVPGQTCLRSTMPQPSSELNVTGTYGCAVGSLAVLVQKTAFGGTPAGSCTIMEITQVQTQALKIQHNPGQGQGPSYNPPASYQNNNNWPAYKVSPGGGGCEAYLVCFGAPNDGVGTIFSIDVASRELRRDGAGIAPNIMDMQAQYGLTAGTPTGPIATWQDPTGSWDGASNTPLSQANVKRIKAIRVAIVARSGEYEKPEPGQNCGTTTVAPAIPWPDVSRTFDTTNWPADWQCYRYKVYETVIPLRNAIWAAS